MNFNFSFFFREIESLEKQKEFNEQQEKRINELMKKVCERDFLLKRCTLLNRKIKSFDSILIINSFDFYIFYFMHNLLFKVVVP